MKLWMEARGDHTPGTPLGEMGSRVQDGGGTQPSPLPGAWRRDPWDTDGWHEPLVRPCLTLCESEAGWWRWAPQGDWVWLSTFENGKRAPRKLGCCWGSRVEWTLKPRGLFSHRPQLTSVGAKRWTGWSGASSKFRVFLGTWGGTRPRAREPGQARDRLEDRKTGSLRKEVRRLRPEQG